MSISLRRRAGGAMQAGTPALPALPVPDSRAQYPALPQLLQTAKELRKCELLMHGLEHESRIDSPLQVLLNAPLVVLPALMYSLYMEPTDPKENFAKLPPTRANPVPAYKPLRDLDYFLSQQELLMAHHPGQFVAIRQGEIVGVASTRSELQSLLTERFGKSSYAFVRQVCDSAFSKQPDESIAL